MRLIDADEFFKNYPELAIEPYINAPTVEAKTTEDCIIAYGDGYETARRLYERPQGEWIEVKPHQSDLEDGIDYREECSICHEPNRHYGFDEYHDIRFATYYKTNYCPIVVQI